MWQNMIGHDHVAERFRRAAQRNRLPGSYLFVGPKGVGKRMFARMLAKSLLCRNRPPEMLDACGVCPACQQVETGNHPDFITIAKPEDKSAIPVDLLIGEKEKRGKSGLCYGMSRKAFANGYKIAVIDDADDLNQEGANALLKTLEEPPPKAIFILIGTSAAKQLPTIRSRCKIIRFLPLAVNDLARLLKDQGIAASMEQALRLAERSDGGLEQARQFCDDSLSEIRDILFKEIALGVPNPVPFAIKLNEFVESAGKEAILRRNRLTQILIMTLEFYRNLGRFLAGMDAANLPSRDLLPYLQRGTQTFQNDLSRVFRAAEQTHTALEQIDRNVQIPYIIDAWTQELPQI
ncbi:MAG: DNA polymerase III subunit [Planctomycetaceae bacterium]|jgi:DNA polymerase-3 subunit delta'|nr:DNA polymerase III subunit [Planctomycetaceae bacterium]